MSTLRFSIVAAAIGVAAACTSSQTTASTAGDLDHIKRETGKDKQIPPAPATAKADFSVEGMFVDCCSCSPPCPCEMTEVAMGCRGARGCSTYS